ncbi:unnamed protein product, partial [Symbiodinium microadriaticum]
MVRELLMIVNLMMILIGDLVRAEGMNLAVAILVSPRVTIIVLRIGPLQTHGVPGVRITGQTGGITPLGETVAAGGAATDGKIVGGNDRKHLSGWTPGDSGWDDNSGSQQKRPENSRGPSEKMVVPTFDGEINSAYDDIGSSARSYVRQVNAWKRMTRLSPDQQALTLYQNLSGKAWIDAEKLDMDSLAAPGGVEYFLGWIKERYLDVQITQVGRSLSGFFRGLRRKPTQSVREYLSEFDRAHARLNEIGCCLPDLAAAWVFVDRMGLDEQAELNLLASVGNVYNLQQLQKAAIVHDRSLRKPWELNSRSDRSPPRREWLPRRNQTVHLTGHEDGEEDAFLEDVQDPAGDDVVPEEVAAEYYESYMTHETAKQRYKDTLKLRGSDPESLRKLSEERLQAAKARSYCAGCRRRGHWHKDACCPLNKAASSGNPTTSSGNGPTSTSTTQRAAGLPATRNDGAKQHIVHVTWDIRDQASEDLLAITDTACSRSVAGIHWTNSYVAMAKKMGFNVEFIHIQEAFRFGASRVFEARHAAVIYFNLGEKVIELKVAVVYGEDPLLISRPALGSLGMIMDVANNLATFRVLGVVDLPLQMTETGHPAFPVHPVDPRSFERKAGDWQAQEVEIFSRLCSVELQCPADHLVIPLRTMAPKPLLTAPVVERQKGIWEMRKDELLREAAARNLAVNPRWTVVELRSVIQEDMHGEEGPSSSTSAPPGLSKMNLQQLKDKVKEIGLEVPAKHNRGLLMRMIRDHGGKGPETLLTFNRYKGMRFIDTPVGYRTWAVKEVANNDNASEDLRMFAAWWRTESEEKGVVHPAPYGDPETDASIPYVPETSEMETLWERVSSRVPSRPKAKSAAYPDLMEQDVPEEILDEVQHLEERAPSLILEDCAKNYNEIYADDSADDSKEKEHPSDNGEGEGQLGFDIVDFKETDPEKFPYYLNHSPIQNNVGEDIKGSKVLVAASTSSSTTTLLRCESLAKEKLKAKAFSFQDLLEISELIPLRKTKKHRCISGDPKTAVEHLVAGMYTHGPFTGLTKNTHTLPWTIKYINSFGRDRVGSSWSSWILSRNVKSTLHSDSHNHRDTKITSLSYGNFTGGELWIEEPAASDSPELVQKTDDSGNVRTGRSGKETDGFWRFSLLEAIPVLRLRLATMTAWCTMAASSFVADSFPLGRKPGAAALFEVGDVTKTLEIADSDFVCMEPLLPEDLGTQNALIDAKKNLEEFEPEMMWVHVDKVGQRLEKLNEVFEAQIQGGRPLVFQFPEKEHALPEGQLDGLLDKYEGRYEWRQGSETTLRFNGLPDLGAHQTYDVVHAKAIFESYMASGGARGSDEADPESLPRGASAISFSKGEKIPDLEKLLEQPFAEEEVFAGDDHGEAEADPELPPGDEPMIVEGEDEDHMQASPPVAKRYRTKGPPEPQDEIFDELYVSTVGGEGPNEFSEADLLTETSIGPKGILLLLQILASNLHRGWTGHAGDVTAAFLCGEELIHGQGGRSWIISNCSLDHCIFVVQEEIQDENGSKSLRTPENDAGRITTGPQSRSGARAKRANSSVCSQLGGLFLLSDKNILHGKKENVSVMDWRSGACDRVCRSTFAAETMACATAIETGIFISRFMETLLSGKLA